MDELARLRLAVVASRHGGAGLAARVRKLGDAVFADLLNDVSRAELDRADEEASGLFARGIDAVLLGSPEYPHLLSQARQAPPYLFYTGSSDLMASRGIGICGSRNASSEGLRAAAACSEVSAQLGLAVISGYARGVDTAAHVSALSSGGTTIIVLPEGIDNFRIKRGPMSDEWDPKRVLVVSQFPPGKPWSAGGAMTRNGVIIGLSLALVVVEAGETGGTRVAGTKALQQNKPVLTLEFTVNPPGNAELMRLGAISARSRSEFRTQLAQVTEDPQGSQLSFA